MSSRARRAFPLYLLLNDFHQCFSLADNTLFTAMDDPATAKKTIRRQRAGGLQRPVRQLAELHPACQHQHDLVQQRCGVQPVGAANNTTSSNVRSSEKYQAGGRTRYNLTDRNYLFGQAGWLSDRFNGYDSRSTLTGGYGRQLSTGRLAICGWNSVRRAP